MDITNMTAKPRGTDSHGMPYNANRRERRARAFSPRMYRPGHMSEKEVRQHLFKKKREPIDEIVTKGFEMAPRKLSKKKRAIFAFKRLMWHLSQTGRSLSCVVLGHKYIYGRKMVEPQWCTRGRHMA